MWEVRERVTLSDSYDKWLPRQLSCGEQQRVVIVRPLVQGYKIILAGDHLCILDSANTCNTVEIFKRLSLDEGCTVIIVTNGSASDERDDAVLQTEDGSCL